LTKADVAAVLDCCRDHRKFSVSERAARIGRNPQTGESINIKASRSPKFSVGASLKAAVDAASSRAEEAQQRIQKEAAEAQRRFEREARQAQQSFEQEARRSCLDAGLDESACSNFP